MRKEVIIAIIIGFFLGLVLAFGFWTANQAVKDKKIEQTVKVSNSTPSPSPVASFSIDSPENNLVSDKNKIQVSGKTNPLAVIVAYSEDNQNFTTADESGFFSLNVDLVKGSNIYTIKSVDSNDNVKQKELTIVYTTDL